MRTVITESVPITPPPCPGCHHQEVSGGGWLCGPQTGHLDRTMHCRLPGGRPAQLWRWHGPEGAQHRARGVAKSSNQPTRLLGRDRFFSQSLTWVWWVPEELLAIPGGPCPSPPIPSIPDPHPSKHESSPAKAVAFVPGLQKQVTVVMPSIFTIALEAPAMS